MRYNLKQKQYKWLLDVCYGNSHEQLIPHSIRSKAYYVLSECGYNREYDTQFRNELLELRNEYIHWKRLADEEDDLPF